MRMKRTCGTILAMVCISCGAMAEQRIGPFLTAMTSVGDDSGSAFGGGVKYEWLFSDGLGVDVHVGYVNDGDWGLIPLELGPIFVIPVAPVSITFGAGALLAIPTDSDADAALGFYASAGARGPMSEGMEWFAEVQYVNAKGDDNSTTTYYPWGYRTTWDAYLDLDAVGLNAGLLWTF